MYAIVFALSIICISFVAIIVMLYNDLQLADEYIDHLHSIKEVDIEEFM